MSPALIGFLVCFAVGPLICAALLRLPARTWVLLALSVSVVICVTLALRWRLAGGDQALISLVALWLAWVLAVAMVAQAFKARLRAPRQRRWLTVAALLSTTLPWFGLATAQMMS